MGNIYITKRLIDDFEFSEIDFDLHGEFNFDYETHEDFVVISMGQGDADATPIAINRLIEKLQSFQSKGATHVELEYHCDHIGYVLTGYEIRKSTDDEIKVFDDKKLNAKQKEAKIKELYAEIEKIKNER